MPSYKSLGPFSILLLTACIDSNDDSQHFFQNANALIPGDTIEYSDIHKLSLSISPITKVINETGFSPLLNVSFSLNTAPPTTWPQAWVAFTVTTYINNKPISSRSDSKSIQQEKLDISFEQVLPKFGIKVNDISIEVLPISWAPGYPLTIHPLAVKHAK
jgi:hypothetical protein